MAPRKKQAGTTGNGITKTPILANEKDHTEELSTPSQAPASIESKNTSGESEPLKPRSLSETVSLLQSDLFDLKSFGCKLAIVASQGKMFIAIEHSERAFGFDTDKGNILIDGKAATT